MIKRITECWICEDTATSGEHRIKHSDLKKQYPMISQAHPLYHRRNGVKQQQYIGSLKSNHLKFDALLCAKCNNERTQVFDLAWEKLSNYLQDNWDEILKLNQIDLYNIFPDNTLENMINVQLFFTKIFGCYIKETDALVPISSFSESLLNKSEHPNIYFSFRKSEMKTIGNYTGLSNIEIYHEKDNHENIYYAHMFYTLNKITVDLIYAPNTANLELNGAIKPSQIMDTRIALSKLDYKDSLPDYIQSLLEND